MEKNCYVPEANTGLLRMLLKKIPWVSLRYQLQNILYSLSFPEAQTLGSWLVYGIVISCIISGNEFILNYWYNVLWCELVIPYTSHDPNIIRTAPQGPSNIQNKKYRNNRTKYAQNTGILVKIQDNTGICSLNSPPWLYI